MYSNWRSIEAWKQTKSIPVGGHPSGIAVSPDGKFVYVANANSDTISVIDAARDAVVETIDAGARILNLSASLVQPSAFSSCDRLSLNDEHRDRHPGVR